MATVALEHVSKRFRDVDAVRDLSIEVDDGEFLVLVGPSGCGKTTVLRLIAGLECPTAGAVFIDGRDVTDVPPGQRNVAMVFEDYALYPHLKVRENLEFALRLRRTPPPEIQRRVGAVASAMDLGTLLGRRPHGLAAGEAQHVAIGRAVIRDSPAVFLVDDALSHLDARQRVEARTELARLHRELGATIIFVTHDQADALAMGTRIAVLEAGELRQAGPPRHLYEHPADVFVAGFIGSPPMNLVEMTVDREDGQLMLREGSLALPAPGRLAGWAADGSSKSLVVGIRPEDIHLAEPASGEAPFRAEVDLVEFLGHLALVHVRVGQVALRAFDDPARRVRAGHIVNGSIRLDRLHVFDRQSGRALEVAAPDAPRAATIG